MKRDHTILLPVLHYLPVIGGFEVFLKNIAERVSRHADVTVITGRVAGAPVVETHGRLKIIRRASLYPLKDRSYSSYVYIATALPILFLHTVWYVITRRATLLHGNGFFNGLVCLAVHAITRVSYVMTIQSADFTVYHEEVTSGLIVKLQSHIERAIYRHARVCHAVSNDLCAHYERQGITKCVMIPNGVESGLFRPASPEERKETRRRHGLAEDAFIIGNISRLEPKNGVAELIDALALLVPRYPKLLLMLIGDGSSRKELEAQVREKGMGAHVRFMGQIAYEEVGSLIASSDAFARTPRAEGFGIVFLEAMSAGVPVIGTSVGGIPDFLTHEVTGLLCEPRDPSSIATALERLITEPKLRAKLSATALHMVKERYDWDAIAREMEVKVFWPALDDMR